MPIDISSPGTSETSLRTALGNLTNTLNFTATKTAGYTFVPSTDNGKIIPFNSATNAAIALPATASAGSCGSVMQLSTGKAVLTVSGTSSILNGATHNATNGVGSTISWFCYENTGGSSAKYVVSENATYSTASPLSFATLFVGDTTTMVQSGGKVTSWTSLDNSGYTIDQASSINQPTFSSGAVFDGTAKYLVNTAFPLGTTTTLSVFVRFSLTNPITAAGGLLTYASNGVVNDYDNNTSFTFECPVTNATQMEVYRLTSHGLATALTPGTTYNFGIVYNGTTRNAYTNNSQTGITGPSGSYSSATGSPGRLIVGARWEGSTYTKYGSEVVKKLVISTVALDSTQRAELETWMNS